MTDDGTTPRGNPPPVHLRRPTASEWGCHACGTLNPAVLSACGNCMERRKPLRQQKLDEADDE